MRRSKPARDRKLHEDEEDSESEIFFNPQRGSTYFRRFVCGLSIGLLDLLQ